MICRFRILLLLLLFSTSNLFAQKKIVTGFVLDEETNKPVENVQIMVPGSSFKHFTDQRGFFKIPVNNLPVKLQISHLAYFEKQVVVTGNKSTVKVLLTKRPVMLDETEIVSEKYKVYKERHNSIMDYDFLGDSILLLVQQGNTSRYELILTNENLKPVCKKELKDMKPPFRLFRDCMENCQLITDDKVYQIYFNGKDLFLIYPESYERFSELLKNCLFETSDFLAFKNNFSDDPLDVKYASIDPGDFYSNAEHDLWKQSFYVIYKRTHEKKYIDFINEWKKKTESFNYAYDLYMTSLRLARSGMAARPPQRQLGDILRLNEMTWAKPAYQDIKLLHDTIYYFNHLNSRIDIYSEKLQLMDTVSISYHQKKNWKETILADEKTGKAYTLFTSGAKLDLYEIDLKKGDIRRVFTIDKPFPEKIKIHNGFLYFIYNDVTNTWEKKMLFMGILP